MNRLVDILDDIRKSERPVLIECRANAPHDGCFWEYNYWLHETDGTVHPLYVSGRISALGKVHIDELVRELEGLRWYYDEFDTRDLESGVPFNLHNSLTWLLHSKGLPTPHIECSQCARSFTGLAAFLSYGGNGGVGIELDSPVCDECFGAVRFCPDCGQRLIHACGWWCERCEHEWLDEQCENEDMSDRFGLGGRALDPGEAEGPPPVVVIVTKGGASAS